MKLKTKLIPLAGVAAVCATVAPLTLTSCGTKTDGFVDLTAKYTPTVDYYTGKGFGGGLIDPSIEATSRYALDAARNPQIYANDYYWHASDDISAVQDAQVPESFPFLPPLTPSGGGSISEKRNFNKRIIEILDQKLPLDKKAYNESLTRQINWYEGIIFGTDQNAINEWNSLSTEGKAGKIGELQNLVNENNKKQGDVQKKRGIADEFMGLALSHEIKLSDVEIKAIPYLPQYDMDIPLISLKMEYRYEYFYSTNRLEHDEDSLIAQMQKEEGATTTTKLAQVETGTIVFENIPLTVTPFTSPYAEQKNWWYVSANEELMAMELVLPSLTKQYPWSVSFDSQNITTTLRTSNVGSYTYDTMYQYTANIKCDDEALLDLSSWQSALLFGKGGLLHDLECRSFYYYVVPVPQR